MGNEALESVSTLVSSFTASSAAHSVRERSVTVRRVTILEGMVIGGGHDEYQNLELLWKEQGLTDQLFSFHLTGCSHLSLFPLHSINIATVSLLNGEEELTNSRRTKRSVGITDAIILDGTFNHSQTSDHIVWSCMTAKLNENASSCGSIDRASGSVLSLPAGSLSPGGHTFTPCLSITDQGWSETSLFSSTSQLVAVFPNSIPSIEILSEEVQVFDLFWYMKSLFWKQR